MKNLKISAKLIISYVITIFMLIVIVVVSVLGFVNVTDELETFYNSPFNNVQLIDQVSLNLQQAAKNMLFAILTDDGSTAQKRLDMAASELDILEENIEKIKSTFEGSASELDKIKTHIASVEGTYTEFKEYALKDSEEDNQIAWTIYQENIVDNLTEISELVEEIESEIDTQAVDLYSSGKKVGDSITILSVILGLISIAAAVASAAYIIRIITSVTNQLKDSANKMAEGNFDVQIEYRASNEFGELAESMRTLCSNTNMIIADLGQILEGMEQGNLTTKSSNADMYIGNYEQLILSVRSFREKIISTLTNINTASEQVLSGSEHVSSGAQGLSQGTTEQASSIEELSATIHTVSEKVNENAKSATEAMNKTAEAGKEMNLATEKMNELVKAMAETKECSDQIGKIIKSIEDIAFQTNILALNAAVEAARAGTAGKGFAVVADEVRNLAAKSAEAASNTNTLIENTISSVEHGDKLVKDVAEVMSMVANVTEQVTVLNTGICDSSSELADSIAQINLGVDQISSVVQTNAATAEQSAAASEELSGQAHALKGLVNEFVLK